MKQPLIILFLLLIVYSFDSSANPQACARASKDVDDVAISRRILESGFPEFWNRLKAASTEMKGLGPHSELGNMGEFGQPVTSFTDVPWESLNRDMARGNRAKFTSLDPDIQKTLLAVYNRMNDRDAFQSYMETLMVDSAKEVLKKKIPLELNELAEGKVNIRAVLRTLVQRSQARGEPRISSIVNTGRPNTLTAKNSMNSGFREAIAQGPFFDKVLRDPKYGRHGRDIHFVQRDFVSDVVAEYMRGEPQEFWRFIGSRRGISYWMALFDGAGGVLTFPERMRHYYEPYADFE